PILNLRMNKSNSITSDLTNFNSFEIIPHFDSWGAKPDWSEKPITNSRSEKLFTSPFWKAFITQNRCLIPVTSFFEWQEISSKKHKQEITFKNDSTCLAGLYGNWEEIGISRPGIWITILTQDGNSLMKQVHNSGDNQGRQPVVIREEDWEKWIHQKVSEQKEIERMITQFKEDEIEVASADRGNQPSLFE
ncbi:MAG: SOS response-associated peptidase family protein, partial [Leptospira sp.]|nr:SOS response-associated peptidase family protein [Leptospira sp.]